MSFQNNPAFSIAEARKRGHDIYEILYTSWGVVGNPATYGDVSFPNASTANNGPVVSIPTSIAGLMIGPRSTVDRAWVTYSLQLEPGRPVPAPTVTDRVRRLSVDSPLLYTIAAAKGKIASSQANPPDAFLSQYQNGLFYVMAALNPQEADAGFKYSYDMTTSQASRAAQQETTVLPTLIKKSSGAGNQTFGFDANVGGTIFMPPTLHLIAFLKAPQVVPPSKRFPLITSGNYTLSGAVVAEQCVAQIPIFGRKRVVVSSYAAVSGGGATSTLRCAVVRAINQSDNFVYEDSSQTVTTSNGSCQISLDNPCADYLMVYANGVSGAAINGRWSVSAYD